MTKASHADELRADFVSLLWAYLEGTNGAYIEWPPRTEQIQRTPIEPVHEQVFLREIAHYAMTLCARLGQSQ